MRIASFLISLALAAAGTAHAQAIAWSQLLHGAAGAAARLGDGRNVTGSMAADPAGNLLVTGSASNGTDMDLFAAKVAAGNGAVAWQKSFAGAAKRDDAGMSVAVDGSGNAIVAGITAAATSDMVVIKYGAADGRVLWQRIVDSGRDDWGYFVAVDGVGNAFVAGETMNAAGNLDVRVLKLAAANGAVLWDKTFDGGADDRVSGVAIDSAGDAIAIGETRNAAGNDDILVLKFSGSTGSVAWRRTYDGGDVDAAYGLAIDASRNVYVAGASANAAPNADFVTLRLDGATGAVRWKSVFDGGGDDFAQAIALDAAGDVYVTGQSKGAAGLFAIETIKYAGASGSTVWKAAFAADGDSYPYQAAVDGAGNIVVAGSTTTGAQRDWVVLAYGTADGATHMQRTFAGSAGQDDDAYGLSIAKDRVAIAGTAVETGGLPAVRVEMSASAAQAQSAVAAMITHFYQAILRRAPDASGLSYWQDQAALIASLGGNIDETWFAMARAFFFSPEYRSLGRDDAGFVTDLYNTFFDRAPDAAGLDYWKSQIAAGMPRDVLLASFLFSPEFAAYTRARFGATEARAEVDMVMDFYRGFLARLPDSGGFSYWTAQFRAAQCRGAGDVYAQVQAISASFANGAEYASHQRGNAQYVADLYNAFLRRGGDAAGVAYWIGQLDSGAQSRDDLRQAFISTPEFTARVNAVVAQSCVR
jgi:hypothetical protein